MSGQPTLTSEQYVAQGGGCCPYCGCGDIEGHFVEIDGPKASQEVDCQLCKASWVDHYTLAGYTQT